MSIAQNVIIEVFVSILKDGSGDDVLKAENCLILVHQNIFWSLPRGSFTKQLNSKSTKIYKSYLGFLLLEPMLPNFFLS